MIPLHAPEIPATAWEYIQECLASTWVSPLGTYTRLFEERFASYLGVRHALAVHSGTAALHLALAALGIGPGDEVLLPALTYVATANAVSYVGATPVFIDVEPATGTLDVALAATMITPRTRAIIAVHTHGHPADLHALHSLAKRHYLYLVEDAAAALGARWQGQLVGGLADAGCFSFYANKIITTGSGGMLVTNNDALAERAAYLANQAHDGAGEYTHGAIGFNYRLPALQAALGLAQLEQIETLLARKHALARRYSQLLTAVSHIQPPVVAPNTLPSYGLYTIRLEPAYPVRAHALRGMLREQGIETRPHFMPLPDLPLYQHSPCTPIPIARAFRRDTLALPSSVGLSEAQMSAVVQALAAIGTGYEQCTLPS
jgi:perosamine synthetase